MDRQAKLGGPNADALDRIKKMKKPKLVQQEQEQPSVPAKEVMMWRQKLIQDWLQERDEAKMRGLYCTAYTAERDRLLMFL